MPKARRSQRLAKKPYSEDRLPPCKSKGTTKKKPTEVAAPAHPATKLLDMPPEIFNIIMLEYINSPSPEERRDDLKGTTMVCHAFYDALLPYRCLSRTVDDLPKLDRLLQNAQSQSRWRTCPFTQSVSIDFRAIIASASDATLLKEEAELEFGLPLSTVTIPTPPKANLDTEKTEKIGSHTWITILHNLPRLETLSLSFEDFEPYLTRTLCQIAEDSGNITKLWVKQLPAGLAHLRELHYNPLDGATNLSIQMLRPWLLLPRLKKLIISISASSDFVFDDAFVTDQNGSNVHHIEFRLEHSAFMPLSLIGYVLLMAGRGQSFLTTGDLSLEAVSEQLSTICVIVKRIAQHVLRKFVDILGPIPCDTFYPISQTWMYASKGNGVLWPVGYGIDTLSGDSSSLLVAKNLPGSISDNDEQKGMTGFNSFIITMIELRLDDIDDLHGFLSRRLLKPSEELKSLLKDKSHIPQILINTSNAIHDQVCRNLIKGHYHIFWEDEGLDGNDPKWTMKQCFL